MGRARRLSEIKCLLTIHLFRSVKPISGCVWVGGGVGANLSRPSLVPRYRACERNLSLLLFRSFSLVLRERFGRGGVEGEECEEITRDQMRLHNPSRQILQRSFRAVCGLMAEWGQGGGGGVGGGEERGKGGVEWVWGGFG